MKTPNDKSIHGQNARAKLSLVPNGHVTGSELLYSDDSEAPFIARAVEGLHYLGAKGYETAKLLELVFGVLNELLTTSISENRFGRRRICVKAIRMLRKAKKKGLDLEKTGLGGSYDPVRLLLWRALEEFENVALRVFALDPASYSQRQAIKREVGNLALSIITAERLSGRES